MTPEPAPQAESPEARARKMLADALYGEGLTRLCERVEGREGDVSVPSSIAIDVMLAFAASPTPPAPKRGAVEDVFLVSLALSKPVPSGTVFSMSQSWRKGGTEQEAIDSAISFVGKKKPGFDVCDQLVARVALPATDQAGAGPITVPLDNHMHLRIEPGEDGATLVNEADEPIAYDTMTATDQAAEVERNLEAQLQTIEACARAVEGSWVISGHVKERVAASVRALRPNQALATQPATSLAQKQAYEVMNPKSGGATATTGGQSYGLTQPASGRTMGGEDGQ